MCSRSVVSLAVIGSVSRGKRRDHQPVPCLPGAPAVMAPGAEPLMESAGAGMARAIQAQKQEVVLVISANLSRYAPEAQVQAQDAPVLEAILRLDEAALLRNVQARQHSMCGAVAAAIGIAAAKALGCRRAQLVRYATSAETTGEKETVVGYAGVVMV